MLGDVHCNYDALYLNEQSGYKGVIQVGDMGIGFKPLPEDIPSRSPVYFIRGNHDSPVILKDKNLKLPQNIHYIPDGTIQDLCGNVVLFIGSAGSLDRSMRTRGVDWWEDEVLSYQECNEIIDKIAVFQKDGGVIDTVVSHDCPMFLQIQKHIRSMNMNMDDEYMFYTRRFLSSVYDMLEPKPRQWYFGHYHESMRERYDDTEFVLLPQI